jgi:hypothetical protein
MTLEATIEHIEKEALPIARDSEKVTWKQMHEWLLELQWYRAGRPMPDVLAKMKHDVMALHDVVASQVSMPRFFDGVWILDIESVEGAVCVQFYKKQEKPWGVSEISGDPNARGMGFGEGPNEVYVTPEEALAEVKRIVERE